MHSQGEVKCPLVEGSDSVDPYEERPLIIDLDDDTDSPCQSEDPQPLAEQNSQVSSVQSGPQPTGQNHGNMYQHTPSSDKQIRYSNEVWYPGNIAETSDNTHDEPEIMR